MAIYAGCLFKIIVLTILGKASQVAKPMQQLKEEADLLVLYTISKRTSFKQNIAPPTIENKKMKYLRTTWIRVVVS
jgi:hypothetical protein